MKVFLVGLEVNPEADLKSESFMVQGSISGSAISGSANVTSSPRVINISCLIGRTKMGGPLFTLKAFSRLFIINVTLDEASLSVDLS